MATRRPRGRAAVRWQRPAAPRSRCCCSAHASRAELTAEARERRARGRALLPVVPGAFRRRELPPSEPPPAPAAAPRPLLLRVPHRCRAAHRLGLQVWHRFLHPRLVAERPEPQCADRHGISRRAQRRRDPLLHLLRACGSRVRRRVGLDGLHRRGGRALRLRHGPDRLALLRSSAVPADRRKAGRDSLRHAHRRRPVHGGDDALSVTHGPARDRPLRHRRRDLLGGGERGRRGVPSSPSAVASRCWTRSPPTTCTTRRGPSTPAMPPRPDS